MSLRALLRSLVLAALLGALPPASNAQSQMAGSGQLPSVDAATRAAILDSISAIIDSVYVLEEPAKRIVSSLRRNLAAGKYDGLADPVAYASQLFEDAQAIHHDGHFRIAAMLPLDPAVVAARRDEDPVEIERRNRRQRARNYGFLKAEILSGGVGYLRFDSFAHGDDAFAAATAAMGFLANSNAAILDLRFNGGGSASMIRYLCGYLFQEDTHLINWDIRAEKKTVQSYSADYVPGRRLLEQPLFILTSDNTFSAAEEFTFDLQNLGRATVVGDTTGGGGHTVAGFTFDFPGFRIGIRVPHGRAYNPKNNQGWEGKGITPDIVAPTEQALAVAHADALRRLIEVERDERIKATLQWALEDVASRMHPLSLSRQQLKEYVGTYGPRRIFLEKDTLYYQRERRARMRLEPMGKDRFRIVDLDSFRIGFEREATGRIAKLVGLYDDGRTD